MNYLKPIDSAPKDGRFILLAIESGYSSFPFLFTEGRWVDSYNDWLDARNDRLSGEGEFLYWVEMPQMPEIE